MPQALKDVYVKCIAKTTVDREAVRDWLDHIGATEFEIPPLEQVADPALLVALAAKQCYMSFQPGLNPNVNAIRKDMVDYLDNVLKQKHGSVLQHAVFTFAVEGCSRVFTAEMNRHAVGVAISERSLRYMRYNKIRYWMPQCFRMEATDTEAISEKKSHSQAILESCFLQQEAAMMKLAEIWATELAPEAPFHGKKTLTSAFRRIIGMGIATGGMWSLNIRALRHVIALRTDPGAEEEMIFIVKKIGRYMLANLPELFGDFEESVSGALVPEYWKV